jgi:hypothetical protein
MCGEGTRCVRDFKPMAVNASSVMLACSRLDANDCRPYYFQFLTVSGIDGLRVFRRQ